MKAIAVVDTVELTDTHERVPAMSTFRKNLPGLLALPLQIVLRAAWVALGLLGLLLLAMITLLPSLPPRQRP
jgi:hypothetical protein